MLVYCVSEYVTQSGFVILLTHSGIQQNVL